MTATTATRSAAGETRTSVPGEAETEVRLGERTAGGETSGGATIVVVLVVVGLLVGGLAVVGVMWRSRRA